MQGAAIDVVARCACELGESPVWSVQEQALYWVDIRAPAVHRLSAAGEQASWAMPGLCAGIALAETGAVLALRRGLAWFDPITGRVEPFADVEPASMGNRLNEIKCDRAGRLWVGSMRDYGAATTGSLYRIQPGVSPARMIGDVTVPNSLAWSPDAAVMYFADTAAGAILAYPYDLADGALGTPRAFVPAGELPGKPDGATVDAAGHLWSVRIGAGCIARIGPDGRIDQVIELPVSHPTACVLGGDDMRTLFVTSARQRLSAVALATQPAAGDVLALRVDVPGVPEIPVANWVAQALGQGHSDRGA